MADAECSSTDSTSTTRKRALPFSRPELIFMVEYLEMKEYGTGEKGQINSKKASVLKDLVKVMAEKFGVEHTERQIVKRYSDLKVRETDTYESIRRKIARDKEKELSSERSSVEPIEPDNTDHVGHDVSDQIMVSNPEELITLTLEEIPADTLAQPNTSIILSDNIDDKLVLMESRIVQHFTQSLNMLSEKMDDLGVKIDKRLIKLESEIIDIKKRSLLMDT